MFEVTRWYNISYIILEDSILRKCIFHNAGDNFLCNLKIAASAYELLVELSYIIRLGGIPRQTDDDDDGRTTDDDDYFSYFVMIAIQFLMINQYFWFFEIILTLSNMCFS